MLVFVILFVNFCVCMDFGVSLAGLEFGSNFPGVHDVDYVSPRIYEFDYFAGKKMVVTRIPFRWERVQRTLRGDLNETDLAYLDLALTQSFHRYGMKAFLDIHNYGRYIQDGKELVIGSSELTHDDYLDFLDKLVAHFSDWRKKGIYGWYLMNEPHNMQTDVYPDESQNWKELCQKAINVVRKHDMDLPIFVPGLAWSGSHAWDVHSDALKDLTDPANKLVYEAHSYFDPNWAGKYEDSNCTGIDVPNRGEQGMGNFVNWLRTNNKKGAIYEINVSRDQCWMDVLDGAMKFAKSADDVIESMVFWAGGPWWGDYRMTLDPTKDGEDRPQMTLIEKYID